MSIRPRGNSFMVDVKVKAADNPSRADVRIRVSAIDRDKAIRLETLIRAEVMRTGTWSGEDGEKPKAATKGRGTLKAAVELAWNHPFEGWALQNSGDSQHRNAKHVLSILGEDKLCAEITEEDYQHVAEVLKRDCHNSSDTVVKKLQALHRSLYFARKAGWIKARPEWKRPTPGMPRQYLFTREVEANIISYFEHIQGDPEMADMFSLAMDTGARLGELNAIEAPGDVDLYNRFLKVRGIPDKQGDRRTKNGEVRTVVLVDRAIATIKRRLEAVGHRGLLFPRMTNTRVSRLMRMAREEFDREDNREFTFHAARHTCATRMAEAGMEMVDMMEQLGHKTPAITLRYIKLAPAARRARILAGLNQPRVEQPTV